jgi:DNA-binding SARP family transcriptional activator
LLRGFELRYQRERVALPAATQRLVALLALNQAALAREYIAGVLWLEHSQEAANANLRTALWRLKRRCGSVIDVAATHLSLGDDVTVDVHEVGAIARRLANDPSASHDDDVQMVMMAGELLPDWYDYWVEIDRERFRQTRLHALDSLCPALAREGRYAMAIEVGLTAVAAEPLRESAHRAVILAHLEEGNFREALRQYEMCRRLLGAVGIESSPELEELRRLCSREDVAVLAAA